MIRPFAVQGPRLVLRPLRDSDAPDLLEVQQYNREPFEPFMPQRTELHFTIEAQYLQIDRDRGQWEQDGGYAFAMTLDDRIIGRMALSNIVRGAWQNATLGYWVDTRFQGRGMATEGVLAVLAAGFGPIGLHRVQAAIMPHNAPSLAVIEKAGFTFEGRAPLYLQINGKWEDHLIFSKTQENYAVRDDMVVSPLPL